jgi:hypothetical protein
VGRIEVERERGPQDKMVRLLQDGRFHDTIASELLGNPLANREHGAPFCKKNNNNQAGLLFCHNLHDANRTWICFLLFRNKSVS